MTGAAVLVILAALVLLSALFSGFETGFFSSNQIRVRYLAENEGQERARRMMAHYERPGRLISTLLVGNNLVLVLATLLLTAVLGETGATLVATPLFILFGEVLPKSVFRTHPTRLSLALMPAMRFFELVLLPAALPVAWCSDRLMRLVAGGGGGALKPFATVDEMRSLVDEGMDAGSIEPEEQEMIHSVMDLQTRHAKDVMVPRIDVTAVPETVTRHALLAVLTASGKTRIPVYAGSMDKIVGVANAFDLLTDRTPDREDIARFLRPVMHVPDTMKLDDLLQAMRHARQPLAVVIDEFGGTDGIVCIEDILEEIFGEIHDEHDVLSPQFRRIGPAAYVIDGRMDLEECAEALQTELDDGEVKTVGGWVTHVAGRIPARGEVIRHGAFEITVLEGTPSRVSSIRLEVKAPPAPPESPPRPAGGPSPG
ncbi:MAG: HlyC/CorC family transporter [Candidatus Hydrogenedentes bacterium]|nr:HlyC/CorC family transporter [Candidatus Hydrogenedentota bacterium]